MNKIWLIAGSVLILLGMILLIVSCGADYEFTVKYYTEQPDGSYVESSTEVLTTEDSVLNFEPAAKDHYTVNTSKSKLTANFKEEDDVVIAVYYDANRYTVTFDIGALTLDSGNLVQSIFYGEDAIAPTVSSNDKAKFLNWDTTFTDVAGNITVKAVCNTDATIKVYHKIEQNDGSYVTSLVETKTVNATLGDYTHTPAELAHYTVNVTGSSLLCTPSVNAETAITVCYDRATYTVTFNLAGLTHTGGVLTQTVKYGDKVTLPTFTNNNGCIFLEWDADTTAAIDANTVFTAKVNSTATVKVNVYREQPNGQFAHFETLNIEADARVGSYTYSVPSVVGYALNTSTSTTTGSLTVNQETELTVYYNINRYTVTFVANGLTHVSGDLTQTIAHGEAATAPTVANTATHAFVEWDSAFDSITGNLTVTAVTTTDAPIKVITYKENLDGSYDKAGEETIFVNATLGTYTHTPNVPAHYTLNTTRSTLAVAPSMLETQTVEVYYDLARYTVTFVPNGLTHVSGNLTQTVKHGGAATAPTVADTATGAFLRWNNAFDNVTSDLVVTAVINSDATVKVMIYKENLDGDYVFDSEKTVYANATLPSFTYSPSSISHYTVNTTESILTVEPSMLEVKTVKVYYDLARYTVTFNIGALAHTGGGDLTQTVPYGGAATAPEVSGTRTAEFKNWNKTFTNVASNITVSAVTTSDATVVIKYYYESLEGGYTEGTTETKTVSAIPETYSHAPSAKTGYSLSTTYGNTTCALHAGRESTVEIYYDLKEFTVTFIYGELTLSGGNAVQTVKYGGAAEEPTIANTLTTIFVRWDKSFDNITSNLTVTAVTEQYKPIYTRSDLECIALDLSGNYILAANINLSGTPWTPLGTFTGKLLGNGFTISGLTFSDRNEVGLFTNNIGIIDGITLTNCSAAFTITNNNSWAIGGSLLAYKNNGTIKNCRLTGTNNFTYKFAISYEVGCYTDSAFTYYNWTNYYRAGGFACYNYGTIENCSIDGALNFSLTADLYYKFNTWFYTNVGSGGFTINAKGYFGGFCSENNGTIKNCTSTAAIKSTSYAKAVSETSGSGRNDVYAYTNVTFGTVTATNTEKIEGVRTLVGTLDYGSKSVNCSEAHASNSVTTDTSRQTLVGTNSGTITSSVATTS